MVNTEPKSIRKAKTMYKACMNISKFSRQSFIFPSTISQTTRKLTQRDKRAMASGIVAYMLMTPLDAMRFIFLHK